MKEITCQDCGERVPDEHLEIDEDVRTLVFVAKRGEKFRVSCVTTTDHDEFPKIPFTDGKDCDLCLACLIKSLQEVAEIAEPVAAGSE